MKILNYNTLSYKDTIYYKYSLAVSILEYFKERHKEEFKGNLDTAITMLDWLLDNNYFIYFVVDNTKDDIVVGFVAIHIENQWGMLEDYLVTDYLYIHPNYRKGKVSRLLFITIGKVSLDLGLDVIGTAILGSNSNYGNILKVGGTPIATHFEIKRSSFMTKYNKYMKGYV